MVVTHSLIGCSTVQRTVDVAKLGPASQIVVYEEGRLVFERAVAEGSVEEKAVASWLRSHSDGWRTDFNSYAPSRRVNGTNFTLDFSEVGCVLNYRSSEKGGWKQVTRMARAGDTTPDVFAKAR